jgi:hypothetical protein
MAKMKSPGREANVRHLLTTIVAVSAIAALCGMASARPFSDPRAERSDTIDQSAALEPRDPACQARTLVSAGGAFPRNPHTLAVRWVGFANFELVYNAVSSCSMPITTAAARFRRWA